MRILDRLPIGNRRHKESVKQELTETVEEYDITLLVAADTLANESPSPIAEANESAGESQNAPAPKQTRLVSLDAFRGLTIVLMLLVNNIALDRFTPGALVHGAWNQGLSLADYVFPWFLLCVGLSIPFSFASFAKKGLPSWRHDVKIWSRFALLMGFGILINCAAYRQLSFSLGVLQLIAMAYVIGAYAYELPKVRKLIVALVMLGGYAFAIKYLPIPGAATGSFGENANFFGYINNTFLVGYNLDGLFSAIPTGALVILGSLVGDALLAKKITDPGKIGIMVLAGSAMCSLGMWCNLWIPYNKPVWTPSYILVTGGVGVLVLAAFFTVADMMAIKKWTFPLLVFGSNAMLAYALPIFVKLLALNVWNVHTGQGNIPVLQAMIDWCVGHFGRIAGGWTFTWLYIGFWWLVLLYFYRRRTFLRV